MTSRLAIINLTCLGLFAFLAPSVSAAPTGIYKGETANGQTVKLKVKRNRIRLFQTKIRATCYSGKYRIRFVYPPPARPGASLKIKADNSFKAVFNGSRRASLNDDRRTLKGKFLGRQVSGTIKLGGLCRAETTFAAKK